MIKAGIVGATGYMGGEALRVLMEHPGVEVAWATSRTGKEIADFHPNLYKAGISLIRLEEATPCDVVFLALPASASLDTAEMFLNQGCKVIDLGGAFRLTDKKIWENVYGQKHSKWHLMKKAVYGISELHKEAIKKTDLVANPGCFSSAAILGLAPFFKKGLVDTNKVIVDGLSGTAGMGAELSRAAHHPEIGNNLVPYNVVNHRHTYEMEQELGVLTKKKVSVHFTPVYVPIIRGILDICHVFPERSVKKEDVIALYKDFYKEDSFIKVYDLPKEENTSWQYKPYPWVNSVVGTNYCYIGCDVDHKRNRIVIFTVLDSIGKGGAQAGIENMNLMFGLDRMDGLKRRGTHPA